MPESPLPPLFKVHAQIKQAMAIRAGVPWQAPPVTIDLTGVTSIENSISFIQGGEEEALQNVIKVYRIYASAIVELATGPSNYDPAFIRGHWR
jgi:hypothetical protein